MSKYWGESQTSARRIVLKTIGGTGLAATLGTGVAGAQEDDDSGGVADREKWVFETDDWVYSSPTVVDGTVFVGSGRAERGEPDDTNLYAVDAETGEEEWAFGTGAQILSSPTVVDGTVFVGSSDDNLYAVDADTGDQQWAFETDGPIGTSSPTVVDGTVFVGSWDANLYALDVETGDQQWTFETGDRVGTPTVVDNTVFIGSDDDNLYAVDADTGDPQWTFETGGSIGTSSPTVVDGTVFVGSSDNSLYAVDANTGDQQWAFETGAGVSSSPTVVDGTVFVGSSDNNLYAVDANMGTQEWAFETNSRVRSSPTVVDGTVFVGSQDDNNLYAVDADVEGSSQDSRVNLGTLGHHHVWAEEQEGTIGTPETEVDLGILTADSGPLGPIGSVIGDAAELPAEQLLDADNLDLNIDIVREDTESDPSVGVEVAEQLVSEDISVTVGPTTSPVTAEVSEEVLIPNEIVGISPSATDPALRDLADDGFAFRTVPSDIWQSQAGAKYAVEELGAETVGTLWLPESSDGFSALPELEAAFVEEVELRGGTVAERVELEQDAESYADDLGTVLDTNPDVLYVLAGFETGVQLLEEFYDEFADDHTVDILVSDLLANDAVPEAVDAPLDGVTGTVQAAAGPGYGEFSTLYEDEFDRLPETFTSNAYDAAAVALLASIAADTSEGGEIRNAIRSITQSGGTEIGPGTIVDGVERLADGDAIEYHGAATELTFDDEGDVEPPMTYDIFTYENEETTIIDTIDIGDTTDHAVFSIEIVSPDDGEEVTEDEALDVVVEVTNTGGHEAEQTIELTAPIGDEIDLGLAGGATDTVTFEIPGDEMNGDVEITVESPDDADQVTVTAADPCFIATAAYDTPTADEIDVLRDFRDDVLKRNALGQLFIKTYYRGSPPIARWIRRNSTRRELVKQYFVEPLVNIVQTRSSMWKHEREQ